MSVPGSKTSTMDDMPGIDRERNGNQLFDLLGGEPERLGLDLRVGRAELREDVHRRAAQLHDADNHYSHREAEYQEWEAEAESDDGADHGRQPRVTLIDAQCSLDSARRETRSRPLPPRRRGEIGGLLSA